MEVNELNCGRAQRDEPQAAVEQRKEKREGENRERGTGPVDGRTVKEKEKYKAEKLKKEWGGGGNVQRVAAEED